jgi:hypothetical protein
MLLFEIVLMPPAAPGVLLLQDLTVCACSWCVATCAFGELPDMHQPEFLLLARVCTATAVLMLAAVKLQVPGFLLVAARGLIDGFCGRVACQWHCALVSCPLDAVCQVSVKPHMLALVCEQRSGGSVVHLCGEANARAASSLGYKQCR